MRGRPPCANTDFAKIQRELPDSEVATLINGFAALEMWQAIAEARDRFGPPCDPRVLMRPTREFDHPYTWTDCQWMVVES